MPTVSELMSQNITNLLTSVQNFGNAFTYEGKRVVILNPYASKRVNAYKGQLHCHTTNSDGVDTPANLATAYKNAGYGFVAITDHDFITPDPGVVGITYVPGIEELIGGNHAHIMAYDVTEQSTSTDVASVLDFHRKRNKTVGIAHPEHGTLAISQNNLKTLERYNFIEVYNKITNTYGENSWDIALSLGKKVFAIAVDDCHDVAGVDFNKGWVVVFSNSNTKADIMEALREGNFYASNGNDITISVSDKIITASSSSISNFQFIGKDGYVYKTENSVLFSSYTLKGDEKYIRVKSTKVSDGKAAWSQPIFLDLVEEDITPGRIVQYSVDEIYRNALINGSFNVWQRGDTFTSNLVYCADRWKISTNASSFSVTRQIAADEYGENALRMTLTTKGGEFTDFAVIQALETINSRCFAGKTVTFSVLLRKNATFNAGSARINIYSGTGTDESTVTTGRTDNYVDIPYSSLQDFNWTLVTVTATIGWDKTQLGVVIRMNDPTIPDGSFIEAKGAKLNLGSVSLPHQPRSYSEELRLCQRYLYRINNENDASRVGFGTATSTTVANVLVYPKVTLRTFPTLSVSSAADFNLSDGATTTAVTGITLGTITSSKEVLNIIPSVAAGLTQFRPYFLEFTGTGSKYLQLEAEL